MSLVDMEDESDGSIEVESDAWLQVQLSQLDMNVGGRTIGRIGPGSASATR
jgi:hypothetical protein